MPESFEALETVTAQFWKSNPDLQRAVLRDWYCYGKVSKPTNNLARIAVDKWLASAKANMSTVPE